MIGDLVLRHRRDEPEPRNTPPGELLNWPHKLCECGETPGSCCSPIPIPRGLP